MHRNQSNEKYLKWQQRQRRDLHTLERSTLDLPRKKSSAEIVTLDNIEQKLVEKELYM